MRCDGLELLTLFEPVPEEYRPFSPSVHLPFAIDWYRAWSGNIPEEESGNDLKYITFGNTREQMVENIRLAIQYASELDPAYGVFHAGNSNFDEITRRNPVRNDKKVFPAFVEMINETVSGFRGGEPPFKLAFENLWWEGLRLADPGEYRYLEHKLEFDNWGFCLDTGHMMSTLDDSYDETRAIDGLLKIFDTYPRDMKDRIGTMHLHLSTSAEYRHSFEHSERPPGESMEKTLERTYPHIIKIDQHRPFSDRRCTLLTDALEPEFVTHEMIGSGSGDPIEDFVRQRSLFP